MKNFTCHIFKRTLQQKKGKTSLVITRVLGHSWCRRYSLQDGASSFSQQARGVAFDLAGDETVQEKKARQSNWDKKKKKFVKGDGIGADNVKLIKTENGVRLPASYRSGRFEEWKAKSRISLPRTGEIEPDRPRLQNRGQNGRKFRHNKVSAPKQLDKLGKNYERKVRQLKKKHEGDSKDAARPSTTSPKKERNQRKPSRYGGKSLNKVKSELKTSDQIRRQRKVMERRKARNARPTKKYKR